MFDEKPPTPILQQLYIYMIAFALTALGFVVSFVIWRQTLEAVLFIIIPDRFVARLVYMFIEVVMAFVVVLIMLVGEPWLSAARKKGQLWPLVIKIAGGMLAFGAVGLLLGLLMART